MTRACGCCRPTPAKCGRCSASCAALPLLLGARGGAAADLDALAKVVAGLGELAASVPGLQALEVNPLWVSGAQIEALDVLVIADEDDENEHADNANGAG